MMSRCRCHGSCGKTTANWSHFCGLMLGLVGNHTSKGRPPVELEASCAYCTVLEYEAFTDEVAPRRYTIARRGSRLTSVWKISPLP